MMLTHYGCKQDQLKDSGQHKALRGPWLLWSWPWLGLLGPTAHKNWLLGHLHLQAPMQNPCDLSLHQTSVLPILMIKKLELREGKGFI